MLDAGFNDRSPDVQELERDLDSLLNNLLEILLPEIEGILERYSEVDMNSSTEDKIGVMYEVAQLVAPRIKGFYSTLEQIYNQAERTSELKNKKMLLDSLISYSAKLKAHLISKIREKAPLNLKDFWIMNDMLLEDIKDELDNIEKQLEKGGQSKIQIIDPSTQQGTNFPIPTYTLSNRERRFLARKLKKLKSENEFLWRAINKANGVVYNDTKSYDLGNYEKTLDFLNLDYEIDSHDKFFKPSKILLFFAILDALACFIVVINILLNYTNMSGAEFIEKMGLLFLIGFPPGLYFLSYDAINARRYKKLLDRRIRGLQLPSEVEAYTTNNLTSDDGELVDFPPLPGEDDDLKNLSEG